MSNKYRVTGYMRSKFRMEVEAKSKADAIRQFDAYANGGTDWQNDPHITHNVERIA